MKTEFLFPIKAEFFFPTKHNLRSRAHSRTSSFAHTRHTTPQAALLPFFPPLFLMLLFLLLLLSMGSLQKSREALAGRIAPSILRFHILANSDCAEDQDVKLEVRSYLLDWIHDRLPQNVDSKETMLTWLTENQTSLETAADRFLKQKGMSYQAHLFLERTYFPTRVYDNLVIPCGNYDAARVILGEGNGHNWWCVLFPRFCFLDEVCKEIPEESRDELRTKLNQGDYSLLEDHRPDFKIRFFFIPQLQAPGLPSYTSQSPDEGLCLHSRKRS